MFVILPYFVLYLTVLALSKWPYPAQAKSPYSCPPSPCLFFSREVQCRFIADLILYDNSLIKNILQSSHKHNILPFITTTPKTNNHILHNFSNFYRILYIIWIFREVLCKGFIFEFDLWCIGDLYIFEYREHWCWVDLNNRARNDVKYAD